MITDEQRSEYERKLARRVARAFGVSYREALEIVDKAAGQLADLPGEYWDDYTARLSQAIRDPLMGSYTDSADGLLSTLGIGVDWTLINQDAIDYITNYMYGMVGGITERTAKVIRKALAAYYRDGLTLDELATMIGKSFSASRAEAIAVTEITRSSAEGEMSAVKHIMANGVVMVATWMTTNDDLVCPLCGPLNGLDADSYTADGRPSWIHPNGSYGIIGLPPAHVRCRCAVQWRIVT